MSADMKLPPHEEMVITQGLVLSSLTSEFQDMTMNEVVTSIVNGVVSNATLAELDKKMGGKVGFVRELADELYILFMRYPHGGVFTKAMYVTGMTLSCLAATFVVLRLISRRLIVKELRIEDYLVVFSFICGLIFASLMQHSTKYGGGVHIWDCSFKDIVWVTRCLFVCEYLYSFGIIAVKASLLVFYYRITPKRLYRLSVLAVSAFVGLMSIGLLFAMAFQCKPVAWYNDVLGKKCFNLLAFWLSFGILCIISDVLILLLPIPIVWGLTLKLREKLAVIALFSLGIVVVVASICRLLVLEAFVRSVDFTSREGAFGLWCVVELDVAIICACVPACKGLFTKYGGRISMLARSLQGKSSRNTSHNSDAVERSHHKVVVNDSVVASESASPINKRPMSSASFELRDIERNSDDANNRNSLSIHESELRVPEKPRGFIDDSRSTLDESDMVFEGLSPRRGAYPGSRPDTVISTISNHDSIQKE